MSDDTNIAPVVVPHHPTWQASGTALADELRAVLAPAARHAEHIGSTAIPGMAAKAVFDLQISVEGLTEAERTFDQPLADRGFVRSHYEYDHVPAGSRDDPERWRKRLWTRRGHHGADINLHVRVVGSPGERLALLFRDWFRAHPEAVPAYARFKTVLAALSDDTDSYSDVKDPVVDLVITVAESWSTATGWTPRL